MEPEIIGPRTVGQSKEEAMAAELKEFTVRLPLWNGITLVHHLHERYFILEHSRDTMEVCIDVKTLYDAMQLLKDRLHPDDRVAETMYASGEVRSL